MAYPLSAQGVVLFHKIALIALGEAAVFPGARPQVWISEPKSVAAQSLQGSLALKPTREGSFFASGLGPGWADPQPFLVVSKSNFRALAQCPNKRLPLQFVPDGLAVSGVLRSDFESLRACGFTGLRVPENLRSALDVRVGERERLLRQEGFENFRASWSDGRRLLSFTHELPTESILSETLGAYRPVFELKRETPSAQPGRTLIFEMTLFELSRKKARALGLELPALLEVANQIDQPRIFRLKNPLTFGLEASESLGVGRVLARPQIRTKPGEKATFQSGGELPIVTRGPYNSSTTWKNYGLLIQITPNGDTATGASEISVDFQVELSEPDPSTAIEGVPGMNTRRLQSKFDLRTDEETLLTTLFHHRRGRERSGVAFLSQIPLIGLLFGREGTREEEAELSFAIRPAWDEIRPARNLRTARTETAHPETTHP